MKSMMMMMTRIIIKRAVAPNSMSTTIIAVLKNKGRRDRVLKSSLTIPPASLGNSSVVIK